MSARLGPDPESIPIRPAPITVGERAPDFALLAVDVNGEEYGVTLGEILEQGPLLLIFYQDDGMPVCTRELQAFAQEHELLVRAGFEVYGINTNGLGSHRKFQERDRFPYPLISDFFAEAVKQYGFWDPDERKSRRGVVAVGQDGFVRYVVPHFNPGNVTVFEDIFRAIGLA